MRKPVLVLVVVMLLVGLVPPTGHASHDWRPSIERPTQESLLPPDSSTDAIGLDSSIIGSLSAHGMFPGATYATSSGAASVTLGDLNGDQILDIVTGGSSEVSVLLGNEDGTFASQIAYATGDYPLSLTLADLDSDGFLDIVTVNRYDDDVSVLLGNGDGTFASQATYATGDTPLSLDIGDLDSDGALDVVTADRNTVSVLLGNGDGTLAPQATYDAGDDAKWSMRLGDLNSDGALDVVLANGNNDNVSVLLGNGDGTFVPQATYATGDYPHSVVLRDVNADDIPDIVTSNISSDNASVLLGNGDGTFASQIAYPAGHVPISMALRDLDSDGAPDIVTANLTGGVTVLLGNGDGTFASRIAYAAAAGPSSVALGDVNGDDVLDIVTGNTGSAPTVSLLLGNGDGTFISRSTYSAGDQTHGVALGDLDSDGVLDIVAANYGANNISVLMGNGHGTFAPQVMYATGDLPRSVALGDLNSDDILDIVTANYSTRDVSVLLGNGDGTFASQVAYTTWNEPWSVALGDLNSDGALDVVTSNINGDNVSVLFGNGDGTFDPRVSYTAGDYPQSVALGDVNADYILDIVTANAGYDSVSVLLGNGDGTFAPQVMYATGDLPRSVALGDLNSDDILDIVTADQGDTVSVLLGNGDGTFASSIAYGAGHYPRSVALGDVNADSILDIVATNWGSISVSVLLGRGDGTFASQAGFVTGAGPYSVALGDLNSDNALDIVTADYGGDGVSVLLNQESTESAWPMFQHDLKHTGRSPYSGPDSPALKWSYTTTDWIIATPAIGADGTIYVGDYSQAFYAVNPDGSLQWSYPTGGHHTAGPAVGADGTIYVGSEDHNLYALNPDGSLKWSYNIGAKVGSSPAIASDGTIYVGSHDYHLYAINADGSLKWRFPTADIVGTSPAIADDGTIYVGSHDGNVYAVNPDGSLKWSYPTGGIVHSSPALGADGTVYVGSDDGKFYALDPSSGSQIWSYQTPGYIRSSPAIANDGTIYVGSGIEESPGYDNKLYAFNPDGSLQWSYPTGHIVRGCPAVDADGTIYVGSYDNRLHAVNPDGSPKWSYLTGGNVYSNPVIGADGTVYIGSWDHKLYALGEGASNNPANQAPTCAIELRDHGTGSQIDEIMLWKPFDIYVGDSTDDTGITEVRFSSDDWRDGTPAGEWTQWFSWGTSSGDWNAVSKTMAWSFATDGFQEVFVEVKDGANNISICYSSVWVTASSEPVVLLVHGFQWGPYHPVVDVWNDMADVLTGIGIGEGSQSAEQVAGQSFWKLTERVEHGLTVYISNYAYQVNPTIMDIRWYAENLAREIDVIKRREGVQKIDVVAHSMGGLVSRAYIESEDLTVLGNGSEYEDLQYKRDISKLIVLGTPNHGINHKLTMALGLCALAPPTVPPTEFLECVNDMGYWSIAQMVQEEYNPFLTALNLGNTGADMGVEYSTIAGDRYKCIRQVIIYSVSTAFFCWLNDGIDSDGWGVTTESVRLDEADLITYPVTHDELIRRREVALRVRSILLSYPIFYEQPHSFAFACPVNVAITDQFGRIISDTGVNQIPGAGVTVDDVFEEKIFYLPPSLAYDIQISAYATGNVTVIEQLPVAGETLLINVFDSVPIIDLTEAFIEVVPGETWRGMTVDYDGDGIIDELRVPDASETLEGNHHPQAEASGPYFADESSAVEFDASGSSDPDGDILEYRWDFDNDGEWDTDWSGEATASYTWADDHAGVARLRATDGQLATSGLADVFVENVAPAVGHIAAPTDPVELGMEVNVRGNFTDPGWLDTHTAVWYWGDTTSSAGVVDEAHGSGNVTGSHTYDCPGVYTVTLTVTDDDGGVGTATTTVTVGPQPMDSFDLSYISVKWARDGARWHGEDRFTIWGSLQLPEGYTAADLENEVTVSMAIAGESGNDTVTMTEIPLWWTSSTMWYYFGREQPPGDGMNVRQMVMWWAGGEQAGHASFYMSGMLQLPEEIGVATVPPEVEVTLEIPIAPESGCGSLVGEATATCSIHQRARLWYYYP